MDGLGILQNAAFIQNMALTAYNAALQDGLESGGDIWTPELAMTAPSTTETELYEWLAQIAGFRQWVGERKFNPIIENGYALTNLPWENSVEMSRQKFRDNQFLAQANIFRIMGINARYHPQRQLASMLMNYATGLPCWDGKKGFATDHPVDPRDSGKGTFSNLYTNTLTPANLALVRAAMVRYKDQAGFPLAVPPDTIVCGSDLAVTAEQIVASIFVPTISGASLQTTNSVIVKLKYKVLEVPELTESGIWYLARTNGPIKPLIFQKRTDPVVEWIEDLNSSFCKKNRKVQLGADYEAAFGWTFPQYIARCGDGAGTTLS